MQCSPAQFLILFLKPTSVGSCFILSSRVFQRKLPLKDKDSTQGTLKDKDSTAKPTGTLFAPFTPHIPGTLAALMILPLLPLLLQMEFYTNGSLLGMDLFIPSSYKLGKKNSPKWFNSQCAKAVKTKNHRFKQWKFFQTPQSRVLFVQARNLCSNY